MNIRNALKTVRQNGVRISRKDRQDNTYRNLTTSTVCAKEDIVRLAGELLSHQAAKVNEVQAA